MKIGKKIHFTSKAPFCAECIASANSSLFLRMPFQPSYTKEQIFQKLKYYCGYQERSHCEVKEKLYSYKLRKAEMEELLSRLIDEDYLNEERFAIQFAGGKFRTKQWGRVKITYELTQKKVSAYCIKKAMKEINEADYQKTLLKLFTEKQRSLKSETNHLIRKRKIQDYLLQRGYEFALVKQLMKNGQPLED